MNKKTLGVLLGVAVMTLAAITALLITPLKQELADDEELRSQSTQGAVSGTSTSKPGANQDDSVHLTVEGTSIDYAVAQATKETGNEFYLDHDIDGDANSIGCPFIDWRSSLKASHTIIYAHSNALTSILFSEIKKAYQQEAFETIGAATITQGNTFRRTYTPVMALHIDASYQQIQTFAFAENELIHWLEELKDEAEALHQDASVNIKTAKHVLTLITCSSNQVGKSERTLVIFCSQT